MEILSTQSVIYKTKCGKATVYECIKNYIYLYKYMYFFCTEGGGGNKKNSFL